MFYMTNPAGRFFLGSIQVDGHALQILEGSVVKGITGKKEMLCNSDEEAWGKLCELVVSARCNGFLDRPAGECTFADTSATYFTSDFPMQLRGIYVAVSSCTPEQFAKGLDRVQAVLESLQGTKEVVRLKSNGLVLELTAKDASFRVSIADEPTWGSMPAKAKEMFEERGAIDSVMLLPSGKGLWRFGTQEGVLDVYVRAFLAALWTAGAKFGIRSDATFNYDPKKPFERATCSAMDWYHSDPQILTNLERDDLTGGATMKVVAIQTSGLSLFL